jgi:hypothetical protein
MILGQDVPIYTTILTGCFSLAGSAIAFFIGGQTYHDVKTEQIERKYPIQTNNIKQEIENTDESLS